MPSSHENSSDENNITVIHTLAVAYRADYEDFQAYAINYLESSNSLTKTEPKYPHHLSSLYLKKARLIQQTLFICLQPSIVHITEQFKSLQQSILQTPSILAKPLNEASTFIRCTSLSIKQGLQFQQKLLAYLHQSDIVLQPQDLPSEAMIAKMTLPKLLGLIASQLTLLSKIDQSGYTAPKLYNPQEKRAMPQKSSRTQITQNLINALFNKCQAQVTLLQAKYGTAYKRFVVSWIADQTPKEYESYHEILKKTKQLVDNIAEKRQEKMAGKIAYDLACTSYDQLAAKAKETHDKQALQTLTQLKAEEQQLTGLIAKLDALIAESPYAKAPVFDGTAKAPAKPAQAIKQNPFYNKYLQTYKKMTFAYQQYKQSVIALMKKCDKTDRGEIIPLRGTLMFFKASSDIDVDYDAAKQMHTTLTNYTEVGKAMAATQALQEQIASAHTSLNSYLLSTLSATASTQTIQSSDTYKNHYLPLHQEIGVAYKKYKDDIETLKTKRKDTAVGTLQPLQPKLKAIFESYEAITSTHTIFVKIHQAISNQSELNEAIQVNTQLENLIKNAQTKLNDFLTQTPTPAPQPAKPWTIEGALAAVGAVKPKPPTKRNKKKTKKKKRNRNNTSAAAAAQPQQQTSAAATEPLKQQTPVFEAQATESLHDKITRLKHTLQLRKSTMPEDVATINKLIADIATLEQKPLSKTLAQTPQAAPSSQALIDPLHNKMHTLQQQIDFDQQRLNAIHQRQSQENLTDADHILLSFLPRLIDSNTFDLYRMANALQTLKGHPLPYPPERTSQLRARLRAKPIHDPAHAQSESNHRAQTPRVS